MWYILIIMSDRHALLPLIIAKYEQINMLERQHQIFGHEGDFRPRIDYYHDAVRALGNDYLNGLSKDSRLSAERLAYDIEMLRLISSRPLVAGRGDHHFSVSDALTVYHQHHAEQRPDRQVKQQLGDCYKDYTVYFAAIMVDFMEDNIRARKEESNVMLEDCHHLEQMLKQFAQGTIDVQQVMRGAQALEHDGLRRKLVQMLAKGAPSKSEVQGAIGTVQQTREYIRNDVTEMNKAGMRFATSQLMVYEQSRDMVKRMAAQGLNIVGKHTGQTMGDHDKGRGNSGRDF